MSGVKKLFGDAALYGLSSILARLLNFLLTPLLTVALTKAEYGVNSLLYVSVAFAMVLLTYGMETAFFRQSQRDGADPDRVYSTAMTMLLTTTGIFVAVLAVTHSGAADFFNLADHPEYVLWTGLIIAMDVLAAVPFARLRAQQRAKRFVTIKTAQIALNLILNYAFFAVLPAAVKGWPQLQVGWVLIANMAASGLMMLLLAPQWLEIRPARFDRSTARTLLLYGFPLLLAGLPGVANEMADRFFLEALLPAEMAIEGVGAYSAVYKLSIFLILFNQAFRFAAEPYFFKNAQRDLSQLAMATRLFAALLALGVVAVMAGLPWLKHFIADKYWNDLLLLPVLLFANYLLSLSTQVSMWYKLSDRTMMGLWITLFGFALTAAGNIAWIPQLGIMGAAYATLLSYGGMLALSLVLGQKFHPVPYDWGRLGLYTLAALVLGGTAFHQPGWPAAAAVGLMLAVVLRSERALLKRRTS
jgi:O-antigen/teichoic acid export membrane protein